jgi:hypothetical protein
MRGGKRNYWGKLLRKELWTSSSRARRVLYDRRYSARMIDWRHLSLSLLIECNPPYSPPVWEYNAESLQWFRLSVVYPPLLSLHHLSPIAMSDHPSSASHSPEPETPRRSASTELLQQVLASVRRMEADQQMERQAHAAEREALAARLEAVERTVRLPQTPTRDGPVTSHALDTLSTLRSGIGVPVDVAMVKPAQRSLQFGVTATQSTEPASALAQPATSGGSSLSSAQSSSAPIKGLPKPDKFAGADVKERTTARTWVQSVLNWIELTVPDRTDSQQVRVFSTFLSGDALRWFEQQRALYSTTQLPLTLSKVVDLFIQRMQADDALAHMTTEFLSLTLGQSSDCKDLHAAEAAFDSRALVLYPGAALTADGDAMLAGLYGQVIKRGDQELWEEALRYVPRTLAQWKAAVQQAHTIREARKVGRQAPSRPHWPAWRQQGGQPAVRANQASAAAAAGAPGQEDETPGENATASAQFAGVSGKSPPSSHRTRRGCKQLTDEQFKQLKDADRCLDCYGKGHKWWKCTVAKEKLPIRGPNAEELKC